MGTASSKTKKNHSDNAPPINLHNVRPELQSNKDLQAALSKDKEERLKNLDIFVLDNSLRETAVAAIKGQVSTDKDRILESLANTGLNDIIVAAFGELRRPEDVWLQEKSEKNQIENNWWAFSEMQDTAQNNDIFKLPLPSGIQRCKQYGIKNVILEIDVQCHQYDGFDIGNFIELFESRVDFIRRYSPEAKILVNLRDAPSAYFSDEFDEFEKEDYPARLKVMMKAVSMLQPKIFGLVFEVSCKHLHMFISFS